MFIRYGDNDETSSIVINTDAITKMTYVVRRSSDPADSPLSGSEMTEDIARQVWLTDGSVIELNNHQADYLDTQLSTDLDTGYTPPP